MELLSAFLMTTGIIALLFGLKFYFDRSETQTNVSPDDDVEPGHKLSK